jgi:hypothetical protein
MEEAWWWRLWNLPSKLGQSQQFLGFFLHLFFAWWLMDHLPASWERIWIVVSIIAVGWAKEFLYDASYEHTPPQTFLDNLEDWLGFISGCVLATFWHPQVWWR